MTVLVTKPAVNIREELASLDEPQAISDVFGLQTALDAKQPLLAEGAFVDGDKTKLDGIEATADVTDATNVEAAGAVMDGDFTSNGFMKRTGAGTYTIDASTYLTEGSALNDISDVTITGTPANNEILAYDTTAGAFINQTAAEAGVAALSGAAFTGDVSLDTRLLLADGTAASPAIGFTNDSDSGLYYSGGAVRVAFNGAQTFAFADGTAYSDDLLPSANETYALGGTLNRWNTFYTKDGDFSGSVTLGSDSADTITVNGVLTNGAQIYDGVGDVKIGYRNIPLVAATTVGTTHVGKCLTASSTVTVPNSTMAAGDVVSVFNNSASGITLTLSAATAYVNGADVSSATLSAYGVATILFISSTVCVVTGNVS